MLKCIEYSESYKECIYNGMDREVQTVVSSVLDIF